MQLDHLATNTFEPDYIDWSHLGWGEQTQTENERKYQEESAFERALMAAPQAFTQREAKPLDAVFKAKWDKYQADKGYEEGSADLSLIGEFYYGRRFAFLPQKTGSCTISNPFRCWYRRGMWEILAKGELEDPLGSTEFGTTSVSFYAPLSYGIAREIGGLKNGDGGFCGPTIESLMRGVVPCNNGKLLELLHNLGADGERDFPEPQDNRVYRAFQDWRYNKEFEPFLENPLAESVKCTDVDQLVANLKQYKPAIMCSMLAVKKGGTHKGLTYFVADRNNKWAHCMCWCGIIVWHGRIFLLLSNESWQADLIYAIPIEEVSGVIYPRYRPEVMTIGEIDLTDSKVAA